MASLRYGRVIVDKQEDLHEKLHVLSAQMTAMNSSLTLYVTGMTGCQFGYPGIEVEESRPNSLWKWGLNRLSRKWTWVKTCYTRISDILRIGMAYRSGKAYTDTDVAYLELISACTNEVMWGQRCGATQRVLSRLQMEHFVSPEYFAGYDGLPEVANSEGGDKYFYTELGPSMFHNVLMNRHDIAMYSQNAPAEPNLDVIASDVYRFGHKQLHLTGHVRKGNKNLLFGELVNAIRLKCGLSALDYPSLE